MKKNIGEEKMQKLGSQLHSIAGKFCTPKISRDSERVVTRGCHRLRQGKTHITSDDMETE